MKNKSKKELKKIIPEPKKRSIWKELFKTLPIPLDTVEIEVSGYALRYVVMRVAKDKVGNFLYDLADDRGVRSLDLVYITPESYLWEAGKDRWNISYVSDPRIGQHNYHYVDDVRIINSPLRDLVRDKERCKNCQEGKKNCFECSSGGSDKRSLKASILLPIPGQIWYGPSWSAEFMNIRLEDYGAWDTRVYPASENPVLDPVTLLPRRSTRELMRDLCIFVDLEKCKGAAKVVYDYLDACRIVKNAEDLNHYFI